MLALGWAACSAVEPTSSSLEEPPSPRLVVLRGAAEPPMASDAIPSFEVGFEGAGSNRALDRRAIAFVPRWRRGAAIIDPERRLYEVLPNGARRMLVANTGAELALDGDRLVYAVETGRGAEVRTHDGTTERTLASGLSSAGLFRAENGMLAFVAARPGGIAGVWIASLDGDARCMTNCDLRTGERWTERFVALPASADAWSFAGGRVGWSDAAGARHELGVRR
jgi:hypothetical protein